MSRAPVVVAMFAFALSSCTATPDGAAEQPASTFKTSPSPSTTATATTGHPSTTVSVPTEVLTGVLQFEVPGDVVQTSPGCDTQGAWREFVHAGMEVQVYSSDGNLLGESHLESGTLKASGVCHFPFAVEVVANAPDYDLCLVGLGPNGPIPLDEMREDFEWVLVLATGPNALPPAEAQPCSMFWD